MKKYGTVAKALRAIDTHGDGSLTRAEIIAMMHQHRLIKHTDYYTGALHGDITMAVADTLIDFVDGIDGNSKDGKINYQEFMKVLTADDIMHIPAPKSGVNTSQLWGYGR